VVSTAWRRRRLEEVVERGDSHEPAYVWRRWEPATLPGFPGRIDWDEGRLIRRDRAIG